MKNHRAKILWVPAQREYSVICVDCGVTLQEGVDGIEFEIEGDCEGQGETLGIEVEETIGTKDRFGASEIKDVIVDD